MMTNNLQEMIQPKPHEAIEHADFDHNDVMPDTKTDLATGIIASEIKKPDMSDSNYQPETEQALIDYVVSQNIQGTIISGRNIYALNNRIIRRCSRIT